MQSHFFDQQALSEVTPLSENQRMKHVPRCPGTNSPDDTLTALNSCSSLFCGIAVAALCAYVLPLAGSTLVVELQGFSPIARIYVVDPVAGRNKSNESSFREAILNTSSCKGVPLAYLPIPLAEMSSDALSAIEDDASTMVVAFSGHIATETARRLPRSKIVFQTQGDPITDGLVSSWNRPSGRATGLTYFVPAYKKRIELLRDALPRARELLIVGDSEFLDKTITPLLTDPDVHAMGFRISVLPLENIEELRHFLSNHVVDAAYVPYTLPAYKFGSEIAKLLSARRIPSMFDRIRSLAAGATFAYEPKVIPGFEIMARHAGLICSGVDPGLIPVERPRVMRFGINVGEAARLGLKLRSDLVRTADVFVH